MNPHERIYDLQEVVDLLRASKETVLGYVRSGELRAARIGKNYVFLLKDVLAFVETIVATQTADRQRQRSAAPLDLIMPTAAPKSRRRVPPALSGGAHDKSETGCHDPPPG